MNGFGIMGQNEFTQLREALNKSQTVTAGVINPSSQGANGGSTWALQPQSIASEAYALTFGNDEFCLWNDLHKENMNQVVHELPVITSRGDTRHRGFFPEGGTAARSRATFAKELLIARYMGQRIKVSDVAAMTGTALNQSSLDIETEQGIMSVMRRTEEACFHANNDHSSTHYDGMITQIIKKYQSDPQKYRNQYYDMKGSAINIKIMLAILGNLYQEPFYGAPDSVYSHPQIVQQLALEQQSNSRFDLTSPASRQMNFGSNRLTLVGPRGRVEVKGAPFIADQPYAPIAQFGENGKAPSAPSTTSIIAGAAAGSEWAAGDVGDYIYKIIGFNNDGYSAPLTTAAVTISAGDGVTFLMNDVVAKAGTNAPEYYEVYRSAKNGAAETCRLVGTYPINGDGVGGATTFTDKRERVYNTTRIVFASTNPKHMLWGELAPLLRRPLGHVDASIPFQLMLFGAIKIVNPGQFMVLDNVALPTEDLSAYLP